MMSVLSKVSPWTRLCLLGAMVPITFLLYEPPLCLVPLLVVMPLAMTSGVAVTWGVRILAALAPLSFFLSLVYLFAIPVSGEVLWAYGPLVVGRGNVVLLVSILSRVGVMLASLLLFVTMTPAPELLTDMRRRGVHPFVVYILAMAVNLIPLFGHRASCVLDAQKARGLDLDGGPVTRARRLMPLVGPLLLGALADVEKRAMALELRGGLKRQHDKGFHEPVWEKGLRLISCGLIGAALGYRVWMQFF